MLVSNDPLVAMSAPPLRPPGQTTLRLACVVGARPNFMKMAPLLRALARFPQVQATLIHTGQHYDQNLSDVFFAELGMPRPHLSLDVGSGKHGVQTARVIERFEAVLEGGTPEGAFDRTVVVGDVNSTMAAALAAAKLGVPVAHVEAGLRSFDRTMPEEINRIVTDSISDMLLVSEPAGHENLLREGHAPDRIHLVGNVMIDTLLWLLPTAKSRDILQRCEVQPGCYGVVTLHRPSNVDRAEVLGPLCEVLVEASKAVPLVFPIHPRTMARVAQFGLENVFARSPGIRRLPPQGYLDFLALTSQAQFIITDSGGLQEESTALGIPCLTCRENTERPITVERGTSVLVGNSPDRLRAQLGQVLSGRFKTGQRPEAWDGRAADRIAAVLTGTAGDEVKTEKATTCG